MFWHELSPQSPSMKKNTTLQCFCIKPHKSSFSNLVSNRLHCNQCLNFLSLWTCLEKIESEINFWKRNTKYWEPSCCVTSPVTYPLNFSTAHQETITWLLTNLLKALLPNIHKPPQRSHYELPTKFKFETMLLTLWDHWHPRTDAKSPLLRSTQKITGKHMRQGMNLTQLEHCLPSNVRRWGKTYGSGQWDQFFAKHLKCLHGLWFDEYPFTGDGFLCMCFTYDTTHLLLQFHMK